MKDSLLISILLFTISEFCLADDTLSPDQTLSEGQTLISTGEVMEFGFFSPGTSKSKFLGIWYKNTPDIVVWVANRNNPIIDSKGVFTVRSNGTLVLSTIENPILWSSSSYRATSNPILKLLDKGNLVLVDESMTSDESSPISYIWQSFDFPGDTRLPEMKMVHSILDPGLDKYLTSWKSESDPSTGDFIYRVDDEGLPQGLPQITILMGTKKRYRSGPWNGYYFTGVPWVLALAPEVLFDKDGLISISDRYNSSMITRAVMNYSGYAQRHIMNDQRDAWNVIFQLPSDSCDNYGHCGPNGICRIYEIPTCECLRGFKPKSQKEWSKLDWSSGCTRTLPSDCQKEEGFLKFERIKFPDPLNFKLNASMNPGECQDECLKQCNCTAFADPYIYNRSSGCLMWFGDLIDVRELTGEVSYPLSINIRVPISELANMTDWNEKKKKMKKKRPSVAIIIGFITGIGMLVLLLLSVGIIVLRSRRNRQASKRKNEELELPLYDFTTIVAATNNFSHENMIGEGGFGPVYKVNCGSFVEGEEGQPRTCLNDVRYEIG